MQVKKHEESPTIVVFEVGWVGDTVMSFRTMRALKRHLPGSRLVRVARPAVASLLDGCPWIDETILYERDGRAAPVRLLAKVRAERPDVFVNLHTPDFERSLWNYWRDHVFATLTGAAMRLGYADSSLDGSLLTQATLSGTFGDQRMDQEMLRVVAPLGVPDDTDPIESWVPTLARTPLSYEIDGVGPYFCVSPFGKRVTREWDYRRVASAVSTIAERTGLSPVFLGAAADAEKMAVVAAYLTTTALNLVGRTSLPEAMAVLQGARATLAVDSGLMHLSAWVQTPVVAIFGPGNPTRWRPLPQTACEIVYSTPPCGPCYRSTCADMRCQRDITVDTVVNAFARVLKTRA